MYPTISSGETTKVVIVSTPKGMNMFYKMWKNAENEKNSYVPIEVHWNEIPGRDQKFKEETIRNTSERQWMQEFECAFLGSEDTLISSAKLATMVFEDPIRSAVDGLDIFEEPKKDNVYIMCVDTCRAQGADYHAFTVIDVTQMPYKMVGKYRNNTLPVLMYPTVIDKMVNITITHTFFLKSTTLVPRWRIFFTKRWNMKMSSWYPIAVRRVKRWTVVSVRVERSNLVSEPVIRSRSWDVPFSRK